MASFVTQVIPGCLNVCGAIAEQLFIAKHNKKECQSLTTAVACIESFLRKVPSDGVSPAGNKALQALLEGLFRAHALLMKVGRTGPLLSLLSASIFREEFLYINRDLTGAFQLLASGEKLLDLTQARCELTQVQDGLSRTSSFFTEPEQLHNRLTEMAAVAQQQHSPEQVLHKALLAQLKEYGALSELSASELLVELQDLQLAALYGGMGKKKTFGQQTEDFLVQQICAALTPKAALVDKDLNSEATHIPDGYLCPISCDIMVEPVMLLETGQSYEEANIQRWLAAHSTCPSSGQKLSSKLYIPNYNLKKSIHEFALQEGIALPSAPPAPPAHVMMLMNPPNVASLGDTATHQQPQLGNQPVPSAAKPAITGTAIGSAICFRCTRTRWAIAVMVVVVTLAAGLGVGLYLGVRPASGSSGGVPSQPASSGGSPGAQAPTARATELDALLVIKASLDKIGVLKEWNQPSGTDGGYCKWPGVTCNTAGSVQQLNMTDYQGLGGSLPPASAFVKLSGLQYITVSGCSISGTIPIGLGMLANLTWLDLSNNSISGIMPADLGQLSNLLALQLWSNNISGSIPADLGQLSNLKMLALFNNNISGTIPADLGQLSNLVLLDLSNNSISGAIPAELGKLSNLTSLDLSNNSISGAIPAELGMLPHLKELHLSNNNFSGTIPADRGQPSNQSQLEEWSNNITGDASTRQQLALITSLPDTPSVSPLPVTSSVSPPPVIPSVSPPPVIPSVSPPPVIPSVSPPPVIPSVSPPPVIPSVSPPPVIPSVSLPVSLPVSEAPPTSHLFHPRSLGALSSAPLHPPPSCSPPPRPLCLGPPSKVGGLNTRHFTTALGVHLLRTQEDHQ